MFNTEQTPNYTAYIVDTETTGVGPTAQMIEFACIVLPPQLADLQKAKPIYSHPELYPHSSRWKPSVDIHPAAQAVHGISKKDLQDCEPVENFVLPSSEYFIAHNADFDHKILGRPDTKCICTVALARQLWTKEEVSNHKLTTLITELYEEGADLVKEGHSALADCWLTLFLLDKILEKVPRISTWEELFQLQEPKQKSQSNSKQMTHMPFGKHKGEIITNIPIDYLQWLQKQELQAPLRKAVELALGLPKPL
jgi:exodeoxyribonuclease X